MTMKPVSWILLIWEKCIPKLKVSRAVLRAGSVWKVKPILELKPQVRVDSK